MQTRQPSAGHSETLHFHGVQVSKLWYRTKAHGVRRGDIQGRLPGRSGTRDRSRSRKKKGEEGANGESGGAGRWIAANKYKRRIVGQPDGELFPSLAPLKYFLRHFPPRECRPGSRGY